MKKILLILLFITSFANAQVQKDKVKHFVAGAVISSVSYAWIYQATHSHKKAFWGGLGVSILAGVVKESIDQYNYGGFDIKDLGATGLGGVTGTVTIEIFRKKRKETDN